MLSPQYFLFWSVHGLLVFGITCITLTHKIFSHFSWHKSRRTLSFFSIKIRFYITRHFTFPSTLGTTDVLHVCMTPLYSPAPPPFLLFFLILRMKITFRCSLWLQVGSIWIVPLRIFWALLVMITHSVMMILLLFVYLLW